MSLIAKDTEGGGFDVLGNFNARYEKNVMAPIRKRAELERLKHPGDPETLQSIDAMESYYDDEERRACLDSYLRDISLMAEKNTREAQRAGLLAIEQLTIEEAKVFLMNGHRRSQRAIADELNCSPAKVNQILSRLENHGYRVMRSLKGGRRCSGVSKKSGLKRKRIRKK